jgi:hypothetical protein
LNRLGTQAVDNLPLVENPTGAAELEEIVREQQTDLLGG